MVGEPERWRDARSDRRLWLHRDALHRNRDHGHAGDRSGRDHALRRGQDGDRDRKQRGAQVQPACAGRRFGQRTVGWASGHYGHGAVQQRIGNVQSNLSNAASRAASAEWRGLHSIWRKRLRRICLQRLALCLQLPNAATGVRFPGDSRWGSRFDLARRKWSGGGRGRLHLRGDRERDV